MGFRNLIAGMAIAAVSAVGAHAVTIENDAELTGLVITENGVVIYNAVFNPDQEFVGPIPDVLSLTESTIFQADFSYTNVGTPDGGLGGSGFFVSQDFRNDSGQTLIFESETEDPAGQLDYSLFRANQAPVSLFGGPGPESFTVGIGEVFSIVVATDDISAPGNFDYRIFAVVPLPAGLVLMLTALGSLVLVGRRRTTKLA